MSSRGPSAWDVIDAVPEESLPDWDSSAFEVKAITDDPAGASDDDVKAESEIEIGAMGLRREIYIARPAAPLTGPRLEPQDEREVLFTFSKSREIAPSTGRNQSTEGSSPVSPEAHTHTGELALSLKSEKRVLPRAGLMALSDERLTELCADLRESTHLTIESSKGASIRNFTQTGPLLLKVSRLSELSNLKARFIALIGSPNAKVERLKKVTSPILVCDVKLSRVEDLDAPLILVGGSVPSFLEDHPRLRKVLAPAARSSGLRE